MINRQRFMTWLPYQSGSDNQVITVFNFKDRLYNNDNIGRDFRWLRQKRQKSSDVFSQSSRYSQCAQSPYDQSGTYSEDLKSICVRIPNGWKDLVCKYSWFQIGPEIQKPEDLKSLQMATILPKNIWNLNKNLNGLDFQWLGLFRGDVISLWVWGTPQLILIHSIQPQSQAN